jgi:hypothetical protein
MARGTGGWQVVVGGPPANPFAKADLLITVETISRAEWRSLITASMQTTWSAHALSALRHRQGAEGRLRAGFGATGLLDRFDQGASTTV